MFEDAEQGSEVPKKEFEALVPDLRVSLINAQYDLQAADFSVVVLLLGSDRLGCDEVLDRLHEWMDARYLPTNVFLAPTPEEEARPSFWRYWRVLPPRGRIGMYVGAWPARVVLKHVRGETDEKQFQAEVDHIRRFEQSLVDDGTEVIKLWLHVPKNELKKRLKRAKKDRELRSRLEERDYWIHESYDEAMAVAKSLLEQTSTPRAPWTIIESSDSRHRDIAAAKTILSRVSARLEASSETALVSEPVEIQPKSESSVLDAVDLTARLDYDEYGKTLDSLQVQLARLARKARRKGVSTALVFEGWDAAGKGGAIRRITGPMTARDYKVVRIGAPTDEEKARHYLWRFWRQIPSPGQMVIFDRSWYGRVLVERVEGFAREDEWRRAYDEINDFEAQLSEHGIPVIKFWLHLDQDEQLERFEARRQTPYKKYKITDEDYRNREKWDAYVLAVDEMVKRTSPKAAPWHVIAANDKRWARVSVLETVVKQLKRALK